MQQGSCQQDMPTWLGMAIVNGACHHNLARLLASCWQSMKPERKQAHCPSYLSSQRVKQSSPAFSSSSAVSSVTPRESLTVEGLDATANFALCSKQARPLIGPRFGLVCPHWSCKTSRNPGCESKHLTRFSTMACGNLAQGTSVEFTQLTSVRRAVCIFVELYSFAQHNKLEPLQSHASRSTARCANVKTGSAGFAPRRARPFAIDLPMLIYTQTPVVFNAVPIQCNAVQRPLLTSQTKGSLVNAD